MKNIMVILFLFLILPGVVLGINGEQPLPDKIENENYSITCNPTTATIQYDGFVHNCFYTNKQEIPIVRDILYCMPDKVQKGNINYDEDIVQESPQYLGLFGTKRVVVAENEKVLDISPIIIDNIDSGVIMQGGVEKTISELSQDIQVAIQSKIDITQQEQSQVSQLGGKVGAQQEGVNLELGRGVTPQEKSQSLIVDPPNYELREESSTKNNCYTVYNLSIEPRETKQVTYTYLPTDLTHIKWDTLIINNGTIELKLDPQFSSTIYEIGTNRSSQYLWYTGNIFSINASQINNDLSVLTSNFNNLFITNSANYLFGTNKTQTGGAWSISYDSVRGQNYERYGFINVSSGAAVTSSIGQVTSMLEATGYIFMASGTTYIGDTQGNFGGVGPPTTCSGTVCEVGTGGSGSGGGGAGGFHSGAFCPGSSGGTPIGAGGGAGYGSGGVGGGGTYHPGSAGGSYGSSQGDDFALGSGGGGGGGDCNVQVGSRGVGAGGTGGGAIYFKAPIVTIHGSVSVKGGGGGAGTASAGGIAGGGGGSGGTIFIEGNVCDVSGATFDVSGASGGGASSASQCCGRSVGGGGSAGRIKFKCNTLNTSGTTFNFVSVTAGTMANTTNTTSVTSTQYLNNSYAQSRNISLLNYVSNIRVNMSFVGNVTLYISLTGNASDFMPLTSDNLSNILTIYNLSTPSGGNNQLFYNLTLGREKVENLTLNGGVVNYQNNQNVSLFPTDVDWRANSISLLKANGAFNVNTSGNYTDNTTYQTRWIVPQ